VACAGIGLLLLIVLVPQTWRAYRRASRRGAELSAYAEEQATEIERLASSLNEHGFELEHSAAQLAPRLLQLSGFLRQPLVAASVPWILRRLLLRPYRRR
jgi:hypothetical protein